MYAAVSMSSSSLFSMADMASFLITDQFSKACSLTTLKSKT